MNNLMVSGMPVFDFDNCEELEVTPEEADRGLDDWVPGTEPSEYWSDEPEVVSGSSIGSSLAPKVQIQMTTTPGTGTDLEVGTKGHLKNSGSEYSDQTFKDAVTGEDLPGHLVREARQEELDFMDDWRVWDLAPRAESWRVTGRKP